MANIDNLRPIKLSHDEATKNGRKGGLASVEVRRRRKELREFLNEYLDQEAVPSVREWMQEHGVDPDDCCNLMALLLAVFCRAMEGDVTAAKTIIEWAGMEPMQEEREETERLCLEQTMSQAGVVSDRDGNGKEKTSDVIFYEPTIKKDSQLNGRITF